jgi:hypothetical protein
MSIQNLPITQPRRESRAPSSGRSRAAEISFLDRLTQTTAEAQAKAANTGRTAFTKDALLSGLFDFKSAMLERMKQAKENEEEQEAWEKLMKYLDVWIESLREEADARKIARAHAALMSLQTDAGSDRKDLVGHLLEQLENIIL